MRIEITDTDLTQCDRVKARYVTHQLAVILNCLCSPDGVTIDEGLVRCVAEYLAEASGPFLIKQLCKELNAAVDKK